MVDAKPGVVMCLTCKCVQTTDNPLPAIPLKCGCGEQYHASKTLIGKRFACGKCGSPIQIK